MADTRTETPDEACSRCGRTFEHLHLFEGRPGQFCRDCAVEMLASTTAETPADEMREAAARLRKIGSAASRPPWRRYGMAMATGSGVAALAYNGVDADWIALASPELAEPLASWLESAARVAREHPQDPDYAGLPDAKFCTACNDEETTCVAFVDHALAVARVLHGGPS